VAQVAQVPADLAAAARTALHAASDQARIALLAESGVEVEVAVERSPTWERAREATHRKPHTNT